MQNSSNLSQKKAEMPNPEKNLEGKIVVPEVVVPVPANTEVPVKCTTTELPAKEF